MTIKSAPKKRKAVHNKKTEHKTVRKTKTKSIAPAQETKATISDEEFNSLLAPERFGVSNLTPDQGLTLLLRTLEVFNAEGTALSFIYPHRSKNEAFVSSVKRYFGQQTLVTYGIDDRSVIVIFAYCDVVKKVKLNRSVETCNIVFLYRAGSGGLYLESAEAYVPKVKSESLGVDSVVFTNQQSVQLCYRLCQNLKNRNQKLSLEDRTEVTRVEKVLRILPELFPLVTYNIARDTKDTRDRLVERSGQFNNIVELFAYRILSQFNFNK